ncbi:MAG: heavy metal translocating P-type ATPase [Lachnospiraceae bacterium]|nr:heavy metal translocating P-type ATPase [Lachnospiraceae bacterium]
MRCRILHESKGRMRVHFMQRRMTIEQADLLEAYLAAHSCVLKARSDERTGNLIIHYRPDARSEILDLLSSFSYESARESVALPEHSTRALSRTYEDRMFFHILKRGITRFLLPLPIRTAVTVAKSVPYIARALKSLASGRMEVSVLDAASITVSMLRGEFNTAGSVMFLLGIGDIMEEWTHRKSVEDLAGAMSLNVDRVWMRSSGGQEVLTSIDKIHENDVILVRTGNMIPLDGTVLEGDGMVNQASITGEPLPVHKRPGSMIYAGTVVDEGELAITVRQESGTGRYDRIVKMIEESEKLKSSTEDKASHLADKLVPWTLGASALTWLISGNAARAAAILMVDFSCALKLSMPISVLSAMREAGTHKISVKGGKFLENCSEASTIVFDKTGTLTCASPSVRGIEVFGGSDPDEMLRLAACLEEHYPHSMANAVVHEAQLRSLEHEERHSSVEYIVAHGIASSIDGEKVCIGSYHFIFEDEQAEIPEGESEHFDSLPDEYSHLYMAIDGRLAAVILIEDPLKAEAAEIVGKLHELGIQRVVMMTGDSDRTARAVAARVGVDGYYAEVLPEEKADFIRREHDAGRKVIMVGDGVNDSPALSESDCGVAINSGAAIAREIADITISEDDLHALITLKQLSDGLMDRIHGNYRRIITFNSFLMLMGALGVMPSTTTALLHNASTIAISLKSMTDIL